MEATTVRLRLAIAVPVVCLVAAAAAAYAAGSITATALIAAAALGVSAIAADETRRRNLMARRPSLAPETTRDTERRVANYYLVHVRNSGPGVARKVTAALNYEHPTQGDIAVERSVDSLPVEGTLDFPREFPCTLRGRDRIYGNMTCKDADGLSYWWYRAGPEDDWQPGTESLPKVARDGASPT
jgi:hypothetical protein